MKRDYIKEQKAPRNRTTINKGISRNQNTADRPNAKASKAQTKPNRQKENANTHSPNKQPQTSDYSKHQTTLSTGEREAFLARLSAKEFDALELKISDTFVIEFK